MMYVNYRANPPFVDCNALIENTSESAMTQLAALEYLQVQDYKVTDGGLDFSHMIARISKVGALPCFCEQ